MKTAQDVVNKVTDKARIKMKTEYDKKARAVKLEIGDKELVRILRYDGKHKIADKFEEDVYEVINQQDKAIPVFDVKSPDGLVKKLHRNHLYLLGFMDNEAQSEDNNEIENNNVQKQMESSNGSTTDTQAMKDNKNTDEGRPMKDNKNTDEGEVEDK